jgi:hypothetical protein
MANRYDSSFDRSLENQVANLASVGVWYDASRIYGVANGAAVSSVSDKSGRGLSLTQGTGGFQPLFQISPFPNLLFDGTDDFMSAAYTNQPVNISMWAVVNCTTNIVLARKILDKNSVTGAWLGKDTVSTSDNYGGGVLEGVSPFGAFQAVTAGSWIVLGVERQGTNRKIYYNSTASGNTATVATTAVAATNLGVGGTAAGLTVFQGNIAEVIIYEAALDGAQRNTLFKYFGKKYNMSGLTLSYAPTELSPL